MTQFTWFQMLNNWYCWYGNKPVAILRDVRVRDSFYVKGFSKWEYWYMHRNASGWSNSDYYSFEEIKQEIQKYFLNTKDGPQKEQTIYRFDRRVWDGEFWEDTVCDIYYVDRLTGKEVLRYDAADPANTNPHYGAESDYWKLYKRGYDLEQRIPAVLGR